MKKKVLVTGCNGFVGGYLVDYLIGLGYYVFGFDLQDLPRDKRIDYRALDLRDDSAVIRLVGDIAPDEIYHLAAVANPRLAREDPLSCYKTSVLSTVGLLEACRKLKDTKILFVGSSEEYIQKNEAEVLYEEFNEIDSISIYGSSKVIAETIGKAYFVQYGIKSFFTRSFNHTGPGQTPVYVLSDFARQVAMIKLGKAEKKITTGNIDLERDFLDVRDVVRAYRKILENGIPGESYNVASGKAVSLASCIQMMLAFVGLNDVSLVVDPTRLRGNEPFRVRGSVEKIRRDTGWKSEIEISQTMRECVEYWMIKCGIE